MKIIVMGTGPFAVPSFHSLRQRGHEISLVVTRPVEDAGRRRKSAANPVREYAGSLGDVEIRDPRDVNHADSVALLRGIGADLMFVCDYGQILSRETLSATRLGGINLHGSLLPRYRGAAPVNWAIYRGETRTGVSVIHMTPRLDGGPILAQAEISIGETETAGQLEPRLAEAGVAAVHESLALLESWDGVSPLGKKQDPAQVTTAPRLHKRQGNLNWQETARQLFNQVRAFQPWPGSFTHWIPAGGKPLRLIVHSASWQDAEPQQPAGTAETVDETGISIATGRGLLTLHDLQPAGKKKMSAAGFLRGRNVRAGDRFGPA